MLRPDDPAVFRLEALFNATYNRWIGNTLIADPINPHELYAAQIPVVAHGIEADPIFCYANLAAQQLFGYDWDEFVTLPSRLSAEPMLRNERERLLARAAQNGFIDNYSGIRIGKTGAKFEISNTVVWDVVDDSGMRLGQAAAIHAWRLL